MVEQVYNSLQREQDHPSCFRDGQLKGLNSWRQPRLLLRGVYTYSSGASPIVPIE